MYKFSSSRRSGTSAICVRVSMSFPSQSPFHNCNSFPVPNHEGSDGGWDIRPLLLTPTFVTIGTAQLSALRADHPLPQEIPCYPLLWEFEWNPGLLNADKINGSLENFQGPNWEPSPELQYSHSTFVPYSADQSSLRSTLNSDQRAYCCFFRV